MQEIHYTDYWALQKGPEESQSHITEFSNNLYLNMWRLKGWKMEVEIAFHECPHKHHIYVWSIRFMCGSRNYTHSLSILHTLNLKRRKTKTICCRSQKKEKKVADLKVKQWHLSILKYTPLIQFCHSLSHWTCKTKYSSSWEVVWELSCRSFVLEQVKQSHRVPVRSSVPQAYDRLRPWKNCLTGFQ